MSHECQHFFIDDLIEWSQEDKQFEGIDPEYIYNLLGRCGNLFSKDGNNIFIEQICSSAIAAEFLREANVGEKDTQEDTSASLYVCVCIQRFQSINVLVGDKLKCNS